MNLLTSSVFDVKIPEYNWEASPESNLVAERDAKMESYSFPERNEDLSFGGKLNKKRKSVEISSKQMGRWGSEQSYEPLPFQGVSSYTSDFGGDCSLLRELLLDVSEKDCMTQEFSLRDDKTDGKLLFPRKSEDWDSKPLERKIPFTDFMQKKRQKWSQSELQMLWTSIAVHGNNWSLVNDILTTRSYYQIKDKGRRVLYEHGWTTGRNKKDSEVANRDAKQIAKALVERNGWAR